MTHTNLITNILTELQKSVQELSYNFDTEAETFMDFKSFHGAEISTIDNRNDKLGLSILFDNDFNEEQMDQILKDFMTNSHLFIKELIYMVSSIFSENTNSDACSYQININTDHANSSTTAFWEITIEIIDSLS